METLTCPLHSGVEKNVEILNDRVNKIEDRLFHIFLASLVAGFSGIGTLVVLVIKAY